MMLTSEVGRESTMAHRLACASPPTCLQQNALRGCKEAPWLFGLSRIRESLAGCRLVRQGACGASVLGAGRFWLGLGPGLDQAALSAGHTLWCQLHRHCRDCPPAWPRPRCAGFPQEFRAGCEGAVIGRRLRRPVVAGAVWVPEARWAAQHSLSLTRWGPRGPWCKWNWESTDDGLALHYPPNPIPMLLRASTDFPAGHIPMVDC